MAELVYSLCALTSLGCAGVLLRASRRDKSGLSFWSGLCFLGLAVNHLLVFVDLLVVPEIDLFVWRTLPAVLGMGALLYGLAWEAE